MTLALGFEFAAFKLLFLTHVIFGFGRPAAEQLKVTLEPKKKQFCRGQLRLAKINTTQQIVCVQIPCILVNNDLHTKTYLATIRSCCFLLTPLLKTKLNKKRQKNHKQRPSNAHGVRN